MNNSYYPELKSSIKSVLQNEPSEDRKQILSSLVDYINLKIESKEQVNLNFICTHNSRRSQLAQLWASVAAAYFSVKANTYSGGVEETAFNERAIAVIKRAGFKVTENRGDNPHYFINYSQDSNPIEMFSKLFDDPQNKAENFAAIMTCSDADENCPFIPGTEKRIPVRYNDPKEFDGTPQEAEKYEERSNQIATEMFYVFSRVNVIK